MLGRPIQERQGTWVLFCDANNKLSRAKSWPILLHHDQYLPFPPLPGFSNNYAAAVDRRASSSAVANSKLCLSCQCPELESKKSFCSILQFLVHQRHFMSSIEQADSSCTSRLLSAPLNGTTKHDTCGKHRSKKNNTRKANKTIALRCKLERSLWIKFSARVCLGFCSRPIRGSVMTAEEQLWNRLSRTICLPKTCWWQDPEIPKLSSFYVCAVCFMQAAPKSKLVEQWRLISSIVYFAAHFASQTLGERRGERLQLLPLPPQLRS